MQKSVTIYRLWKRSWHKEAATLRGMRACHRRMIGTLATRTCHGRAILASSCTDNNIRHAWFASLCDIPTPFDTSRRMYSSNSDDDDDTNAAMAGTAVVYESPFGSLVSRLRTISLLTAVAGSVGLPAVVALKGTVPSAGFVALCLSFGTGTLASTAAIHYVFSPYVFFIERM